MGKFFGIWVGLDLGEYQKVRRTLRATLMLNVVIRSLSELVIVTCFY